MGTPQTQARRQPSTGNLNTTLTLNTAVGGLKSTIVNDRLVQQYVLTLTNVSITTTDNGTLASGNIKLFDLPAGNYLVLGATADCTTAAGAGGLTDTAPMVYAIGTAAAAADATLTSTEADIMPSTAGTLAGGVGVIDGRNPAVAFINGTSATSIYLNTAVADAGTTASDTLTVNGTIVLTLVNLGDY